MISQINWLDVVTNPYKYFRRFHRNLIIDFNFNKFYYFICINSIYLKFCIFQNPWPRWIIKKYDMK